MNQHLQNILNTIQQSEYLSAEEKRVLSKAAIDADKEMEIAAFKLERTEKVKRTTAILLEETIAELEQKRKAVETQNRELEIESALERVRTVAMGMSKPDDLLSICEILFQELQKLGFSELRNAMINILNDEKQSFLNYDYSTTGKTITEFSYNVHPLIAKHVQHMKIVSDDFFEMSFSGKELKEWKAFRKRNGEEDDPRLDNIDTLYYYFYAIGNGAIGISVFNAVSKEQLNVLKRIRNVFDLAYKRYIDIIKAEAQAREAQIQLALERVRARTMAMQKSDELSEAVYILFQQFKELGEKPDQATIGIINEDEKVIEYWVTMYGNQMNRVFKFPIDEPHVTNKIYKAWKKNKTSIVIDLSGKELNKFAAYRESMGGAAYNPKEKHRIINVAFFSKGLLNVQSNEERSDESIKLLERFASVFEQTYTRFLDLQKAEAQARESEIELALERVRSKSLAMRHTSELQEVIHTVHKELLNLNIAIDGGSFIAINKDIDTQLRCWGSGGTADTSEEVILPIYKKPFCTNLINGIKKGPCFFIEEFTQKEKKEFFTFLFKHEPWSKLNAKQKKETLSSPGGYTRSCCVSQHTSIFIINHLGKKFSDADNDILKRFGKVFEQSYTRFLDLQKAEAQTREAQIELGLERVRARAMAMQNSDELNALIGIVFTELTKLDLVLTRCVIIIYDAETKGAEWWMANSEAPSAPMNFFVKYANLPFFNVYQKGWEERDLKWQYILEGENKIVTDNFLFNETELKTLPDFVIEGMKAPGKVYLNASFNNFGNLTLASLEPLSDEHFDILLRFAKVFDLTYTRFNDLKNAEAQIREAKIEAALERVRSKTMAMHSSDDVADTVATMFDELVKLGIKPFRCGIGIMQHDFEMEVWTARPDANEKTALVIGQLNMNKHPLFTGAYNGWKNKEKGFAYELKDDDLQDYFNVINNQQTGYPVKYDTASLPSQIFHHDFYFAEGTLFVFSLEQLSQESENIFKRFAAVFGQTYRRYQDLQKAETQAREAQIEAALERVRSRTMAMFKSDELAETAVVMFKQMISLGIAPNRLYIAIINDNSGDLEFWITDENGDKVSSRYIVNINKNISIKKMYEAWAAKKKTVSIVMQGKELEDWLTYWRDEFHVPFKPGAALKRRVQNIAYFSKGFIAIASPDDQPQSTINLLERFAAVFNLTYTRFSDLQIAEAQAREAKIETALERVRSRTMGMQHSGELRDVIQTVTNQLHSLSFVFDSANFATQFDKKGFYVWNAAPESPVLQEVYVPYSNHKFINWLFENKKQGTAFESFVFSKKEKNAFFNYYFTETEARQITEQIKKYILNGAAMAVSSAFRKDFTLSIFNYQGKPFTEEENNIISRFTNVFEQSYTRFLDLQKAETQAREAKIEAALERVRSRSIGMQKTDELQEIIRVVYEQLVHLNILVEHAGFIMDYKERDDLHIWLADQHLAPSEVTLPWFDSIPNNSIKEAKENEQDFFKYLLTFEEKNKFYQDLFKFVPSVPEETLEYYFNCPGLAGSGVLLDNVGLYVENFDGTSYTDEENTVLMRFGKVFQQTYTRFLDLQKAEAQAREAQIELGLERVRARAMAMQKSDELSELVDTVFKELTKLDFALTWCIINIIDESSMSNTVWAANPDINKAPESYHMLFEDYPFHHAMMKGWKERKTKDIYILEGQEKKTYDEYLFNETEFRRVPVAAQAASKAMEKYVVTFSFSNFGGLQTVGDIPLSDANLDILSRFGKVFDLTYTRFNDLKKSEAQARESQIQLALERVRARTMAMQKPSEFIDVINVIGEQFIHLEFDIEWANFGANKLDITEGIDTWNFAIIPGGEPVSSRLFVPRFNHPLFIDADAQIDNFRRTGNDFFIMTYNKEDKDSWLDHLFTKTIFKDVSDEYRAVQYAKPGYTTSNLALKDTFLSIGKFDTRVFTDEQNVILKRFGSAFGQAYTRFLDLQNAEAQAREAQIEAALEKVRSRSLAMHKSDELQEVVHTVFEKLKELNVDFYTVIIVIFQEDSKDIYWWMQNKVSQEYPKILVRYAEIPYLRELFEAKENGNELFSKCYFGEEKNEFYNYLLQHTDLKYVPENQKKFLLENEFAELSVAISKNTGIHITSYSKKSFSTEENETLKRFSKVFEQSYTRFLDLQKAEAQAREAQIEAALERVRASTMAMYKSENLDTVAEVVFNELEKLKLGLLRCGIGIINKEKRSADAWITSVSEEGKTVQVSGTESMDLHPLLQGVYNAWLTSSDYSYILKGDDLVQYYQTSGTGKVRLPDSQLILSVDEITTQYYQIAMFEAGGLFAFSANAFSEDAKKVMKRFAVVFNQSYTRFLDLQKAEAATKEAIKQAALDRIRADIASMRTTKDLERITPLIWNELTILGIPFIRCGVFIMDDAEQLIHTFLSTPDGKAIAAFHLPYNTPGNISLVLQSWGKKKNYIDHWDEQTFTEFANSMVKLNALTSVDEYMKTLPAGGFYLHFLPFLQGMLYVGNTTRLLEEEINLLQSVADAFATAYARYQDFNKLEAAKKQVDSTLTELQSAQKQLIQSEKMASLGELTAGIAHEIQNPLNFVNNFSEVSNELIDEMKEELAKGNGQLANEIADDLKQNLEKINHHGKRAGDIVKGMLQHSRKSEGIKESTDINALADEYLRLSYHGLRAKDKTFNATMKTDFDTSIGKINIIPQDIGRVLLNLFNNAFYAVNQQKTRNPDLYKPTVSVSTKKCEDKIEIIVKDNGNGIPQNIVDKIFQPFFTTKPTGEGTGLGLSLSYDIVKAHGGELKVESKESEGSEFIIVLSGFAEA